MALAPGGLSPVSDRVPSLFPTPNLARVVRAVGAGVRRVADSAVPVVWNKENPKTERYRTAYEKLMGGR